MDKNKQKKPCEDCFCAKPSGTGADQEDTSEALGAKGCVVPAL